MFVSSQRILGPAGVASLGVAAASSLVFSVAIRRSFRMRLAVMSQIAGTRQADRI